MINKLRAILAGKQYKRYVYALAAAIAAVVILKTLMSGKPKPRAMPSKPVKSAEAFKKDVPVYIDSFGTLNALNSVDIRSQVEGQIKEVYFKEGDEVRQGDLLFAIDDSQYRAALEKSEAALEDDMVKLKMNKDTLKRNESLVEKNLISRQDFEQYQTNVSSAEANIELDKANIDLARIQLGYCAIRSPIDGVAGKRRVDPGNIVTANTGPVLVNIKTISELHVDFTVTERDLPTIRSAMDKKALDVRILVPGDENNVHTGQLKFMDNTVDNTTGTISLRGAVRNDDKQLWPGQFVKVRLILGVEQGAVLVPYQAVQLGQNGNYVFVITADKKADLKLVTTGARDEGDIVIKTGVNTGDEVVTSGQLGLSPGMPVQVIPDAGSQNAAEGPGTPTAKNGTQ